MTSEKAIMCLEDMKIKVPIPKAAKQARENNEALDVAIKALQSAEPKRGKWIEDKGQQILMQNAIERGEVWRVCSVCGAGHMIGHKYATDKAYHDRHHNYCPNCGAKMEVTT